MQKDKIFNSVEFLMGLSDYSNTFPATEIKEFAFWGRSNVGKSSLINALCNNSKIARISKTPGRTKEINLFKTNNNRLIIADLPGYGYAKTSKSQSDNLYKLCYNYLISKRATLFFLLIDARRGLMTLDQEVIDALIFYNYQFVIVLTKIDLIKKTALQIILDNLKSYKTIAVSAKKQDGLLVLRQLIIDKI
jgi:GTP-binding protein